MERNVFKGNIYMIELGEHLGSIQSGCRPCIVLSSNINNMCAPIVNVAPLTSSKKNKLPNHYELLKSEYNFLDSDSIILLEQFTTVNKSQIKQFIGSLSYETLDEIYKCLDKQLGRK